MAVEVRLIARDDEAQRTVTGKVMRVTRTRIQVRTPDHLLHWCLRHNGASMGHRGAYYVHPEDVARIQGAEAEELKSAAPKKQSTRFARHWDV